MYSATNMYSTKETQNISYRFETVAALLLRAESEFVSQIYSDKQSHPFRVCTNLNFILPYCLAFSRKVLIKNSTVLLAIPFSVNLPTWECTNIYFFHKAEKYI